jgi:site-specific DNA recombinase
LDGLKERLMAPELVAAFVAEFQRELLGARQRVGETARELRGRLQTCERQIGNLIAVVADGRSNPALLKRLDQLEAEQAGLKRELLGIPAEIVGEIIRLDLSPLNSSRFG